MGICEKFNSEAKQKMKKMIELSDKDGCEYFTIIKNDYSLGKIQKGEMEKCLPDALLETNKNNVIGMFHTHPYKNTFFNETEKETIELFKACNFNSDEIENLRKRLPDTIIEVCSSLSPDDIRYSVSRGLVVDCIGVVDKEGRPKAFCHELFSDSKERMINGINSFDEKYTKLFIDTFTKWISREPCDNLLDTIVLLVTTKFCVKETIEIKL